MVPGTKTKTAYKNVGCFSGLQQKFVLLFLAGFERYKLLHQAALAACGIVCVQNALAGGLIQCADRIHCGLAGLFDIAPLDFDTGALDVSACAADEKAVPNTLALGTANTL